MVSFDLTYLYPKIPIVDTLNIIKDGQFTWKTATPQEKFLDLVHLVLTTTWYTFNSQFYQQTDGVTMGGPASSTTAEICMQAYERIAITIALHSPKVWEQFDQKDHNFSWDQKKVVDRKSRSIPRKIKETIHSLKHPNYINKISYMLHEIWLPNLR